MFYGPVLTNVQSMARLFEYRTQLRFDSIKVITSWGLDSGWNDTTRAQILTLTPNPVVRTTYGDPSNKGKIAYAMPYAQNVVEEIEPWIRFKPDLIVEVGNEPNIGIMPTQFIWEYRYHLSEAIKLLRAKFPMVRIIAPGFIVNKTMKEWLSIVGDVFATADYIGVHAYEHVTYTDSTTLPKTNHLQEKTDLLAYLKKPLILTEFGINATSHNGKPITNKMKQQEYRDLVNVLRAVNTNPQAIVEQEMFRPRYSTLVRSLVKAKSNNVQYAGALFYHINEKRDIDPQYHIAV